MSIVVIVLLMRESERDDMSCTSIFESINGGLERRTGGEDVVDENIGAVPTPLFELRRAQERAAHVLLSFVAGQRNL